MRSGQTDLAVRGCRKRSHRQSSPSPASVVVSVLTVGMSLCSPEGGGGLALSTSSLAVQQIALLCCKKFSGMWVRSAELKCTDSQVSHSTTNSVCHCTFKTQAQAIPLELKLHVCYVLQTPYKNPICGIYSEFPEFQNVKSPCFTLLSTF